MLQEHMDNKAGVVETEKNSKESEKATEKMVG